MGGPAAPAPPLFPPARRLLKPPPPTHASRERAEDGRKDLEGALQKLTDTYTKQARHCRHTVCVWRAAGRAGAHPCLQARPDSHARIALTAVPRPPPPLAVAHAGGGGCQGQV